MCVCFISNVLTYSVCRMCLDTFILIVIKFLRHTRQWATYIFNIINVFFCFFLNSILHVRCLTGLCVDLGNSNWHIIFKQHQRRRIKTHAIEENKWRTCVHMLRFISCFIIIFFIFIFFLTKQLTTNLWLLVKMLKMVLVTANIRTLFSDNARMCMSDSKRHCHNKYALC